MKVRRFLLLVGFLLLAGIAYDLLATPEGSWRLCRWILSRKFKTTLVSVHKVRGSILSGLELDRLEMGALPRLPKGAVLKIRLLSVSIPIGDPRSPSLSIRDARLDLPESETLLISGEYRRGRMQLNLYSRLLDAREILGCFMAEKDVRKFSGPVGPLDLDLSGSWRRFDVRGAFHVRQLNYYTFSLVDAAGTVALTVQPGSKLEGLTGEVRIERGALNLKNGSIQLEPSRILYTGDAKRPVFDLLGSTGVEKIPVRAVFKGTFRRPELRLSSDPPLPQEQLLLMLATGKRFKSIEGVSSGEAQLPVDLVGAFLDYAAFGGSGSRLAQELGVEGSVLIRDEGRTTGLGLKKSLTEKVGVRYGVEQTQPEIGQTPTVRQKVGAELEVTPTDRISVEAESEVTPPQEKVQAQSTGGKEPERTGKVLLKYKRKF